MNSLLKFFKKKRGVVGGSGVHAGIISYIGLGVVHKLYNALGGGGMIPILLACVIVGRGAICQFVI